MKRQAPRPLSLALKAFTDPLAPATTLARVQSVWQRAAGSAIANACRPVAERDGVLTIACSEAVWAQELDLIGADIAGRVNEALGQPLVKALRCRAS